MELKRILNNKNYLFCCITTIACFVFGYILPISIDHVETLRLCDYFDSVYTVITQFGPLVFSTVIIYIINTDYKEKNILFYSSIGYNSLKYFVVKIFFVCINFSLLLLIETGISCFLYNDFHDYWIMFLYYECALLSEILMAAIFAFLFKNILTAFCVNLAVWIGTIILSSISDKFRFLAYYDASNQLYDELQHYFSTGNTSFLHITQSILYDTVLFFISVSIVIIFKKRWIRNGV